MLPRRRYEIALMRLLRNTALLSAPMHFFVVILTRNNSVLDGSYISSAVLFTRATAMQNICKQWTVAAVITVKTRFGAFACWSR